MVYFILARASSRGKLLLFCLLALICAAGPKAFSQSVQAGSSAGSVPRTAWENWFYGQRRYGLGYIPDGALLQAVAERNAQQNIPYSAQEDAATTAAAPQWTSIGPAVINSPTRGLVSGRITSVAVDPTNPATVYIAAAGGGVWKSVNHGSGWVPLTDALPSISSGAVAVDPFTGEVWYGTGELDFCRDCYYGAGVYRSADGGANWTRVNPDSFLASTTSVIAFDRQNQGTIFIGRSTALWKSTDDGQTWHTTLLGVITSFVQNPNVSSIAYAAIGDAFGSSSNGVYRSVDGGETWNRLAGGLPAPSTIGRTALAVDPSSPSTVYALIARSSDFQLNGLYRSRDGGNTWDQLSNLPPSVFMEGPFPNGLFNMLVAVDPTNSSVLYVGSNDLFKSSDGGQTWQSLNILEGEHQIIFDPSDLRTFYLVNNSGIWKSSDGGQSFVDLNNTLAITMLQAVGLHPTDPDLSVGATQDNGTILYRGGFAWEQGRLGDSGAAFYEPSDPQTAYASGHYFDLFRSEDGGKSWSLLNQTIDPNDRVQFYAPFIHAPGQPDTLYFGTQRVWISTDRGDSWNPVSGDLTGGGSATITALAAAPNAPQVLYAGTSDSRVQVSPDGGHTWWLAAALPDRYVTSIAIHPQLPQRAFVGLSGFGTGHIFRTDDAGHSWTDISSNLPDVPVNAVLVDANAPDTVYLGTDIGVFVLAPDGSWTALNQGLPNVVVLGLSQNPATGLLVAATHGRGAFALGKLTAPRIDSLQNAVSFAQGPIAPGMSVTLRGANLASASASPLNLIPLATTLGSATVTINGFSAPLFSVSPGALNFLVPYGITGPWVDITVSTRNGEASVRLPWADVNPGIYQSAGNAMIYHADGVLVSDAAPAHAGEELVLYATGLGAVDQAVTVSLPSPASPPAETLQHPVVKVGGISAAVVFSGLTPGLLGTYQVNFIVPQGVSGKAPLVLQMGNAATSNTVMLSTAP